MTEILPVEVYLTPGQAAKKLGVGVRTIQRWEKESKMPVAILINDSKRFINSEIDAMIRQQNPARLMNSVASEAASFVERL